MSKSDELEVSKFLDDIQTHFKQQPVKFRQFLEILDNCNKERKRCDVGVKESHDMKAHERMEELLEGEEALLRAFDNFFPFKTIDEPQQPSTSRQTNTGATSTLANYTTGTKVGVELLPQAKTTNGQPLNVNSANSNNNKGSRGPKIPDVSIFGGTFRHEFFDKVQAVLQLPQLYHDFVEQIALYNRAIVSKKELMRRALMYLRQAPDLLKWFEEFISESVPLPKPDRFGPSYSAYLKNPEKDTCSGRTALCREVLNETVSLSARQTLFAGRKRTVFEKKMHEYEDERFELDFVIQNNKATIELLKDIHTKLCSIPSAELSDIYLDDCLGGKSSTMIKKALRMVYGAQTENVMQNLNINPFGTIPGVLKKLQEQEAAWHAKQEISNKRLRKCYADNLLKSLDHKGIDFRAEDSKALGSKKLIDEIETLFKERNEKYIDQSSISSIGGPHLSLPAKGLPRLNDAANLLFHHIDRYKKIQEHERTAIAGVFQQVMPFLFYTSHPTLRSPEKSSDEEGNNPTPMNKNEENNPEEDRYTIFYADDKWYLFLRYHAILCERLQTLYERAKIIAAGSNPKKPINAEALYSSFLGVIQMMLEKKMTQEQYQDTLRQIFSIHAYIAFTLDKVIENAVQQLARCVKDEHSFECANRFIHWQIYGGAGGLLLTAKRRVTGELSYRRHTMRALKDKHCYEVFSFSSDRRGTIELLDAQTDIISQSFRIQKAKNFGNSATVTRN
ncbi:paired amphipathic helix protein Sin3b-like isoform X2 [Toxorhynchites rutilus septentrionalis]|uniref:paired amphipathic helix protein Sin3b-like isoform X2 n=1 Tax=Toxorhynchites rutilus septentrionalis TaxID=329112 RepID=UPI00247AAD90|nr:paired amphipathic helix protein Sin3b-like isoform X2 [Toxorhynchites rutilus septentrionalis]